MVDKGFTVAVYNRTVSKVDEFISDNPQKKNSLIGCRDIDELISALKPNPRKLLLMVKAGPPVDDFLQQIGAKLSSGDVVIDGGNSYFLDTERRCRTMYTEFGIHFVGCGVSGGEEGARYGPSMMPGGGCCDIKGRDVIWPALKPIFQAIAARSDFSPERPCCEWLGPGGSGHFVKMVHNGIEYGDMQLIGEAYHYMLSSLGMDSGQASRAFTEWNSGKLKSFLVEITGKILDVRVDAASQPPAIGQAVIKYKQAEESSSSGSASVPLVDLIVDRTGAKGTGKWTVNTALDLGIPVTLIGEAVQARALSTLLKERSLAHKLYPSDPAPNNQANSSASASLKDLEDAVFAAKLVSYAQGFMMLRAAAQQYAWPPIDMTQVAVLWSGGCIIRSQFLGAIVEAYNQDPHLPSILLSESTFAPQIKACLAGWRKTVGSFVESGIPCPALSSALAFFDGYRCKRLPASLLQAQRDFFGAHQFELLTDAHQEPVHYDWIGSQGKATASSYNA